jgi:hypothetical protein
MKKRKSELDSHVVRGKAMQFTKHIILCSFKTLNAQIFCCCCNLTEEKKRSRMTEEQNRISLVSFLFFLGKLICVTYMGPDSLLKQFELIIKRSRMTEEQKRISLVSSLFFLGTLICVTYMGPDSLLKQFEFIIYMYTKG